MPFSYRVWIFGGKTFCCCLPVRFGVISMSVLGMLFAGLLSIGLWFEVATTPTFTVGERAGFVLAAIVETVFFFASILGFVGAIVRKQSFIQTYAYILYCHFFVNVGTAVYLFFIISGFQQNAIQAACDNTITDPTTKDQCQGLFRITTTIYVVVAAIFLIIEMYGAIIVARYLNLVQRQKRMHRETRRANDSAFSLQPLNRGFNNSPSGSQIYISLNQKDVEEFDPYLEAGSTNNRALVGDDDDVEELARPPPPIEVGYGGGSWTHREITDEEKSRLERSERGSSTISADDLTDAEREQRLSDIKSPYGPLSAQESETDSLPQYVALPKPGHVPQDSS